MVFVIRARAHNYEGAAIVGNYDVLVFFFLFTVCVCVCVYGGPFFYCPPVDNRRASALIKEGQSKQLKPGRNALSSANWTGALGCVRGVINTPFCPGRVDVLSPAPFAAAATVSIAANYFRVFVPRPSYLSGYHLLPAWAALLHLVRAVVV